MNRQLFITIHLYLSSFFAAAVLLVACSGGLYLLGVKGDKVETAVAAVPAAVHTLGGADVEGEVRDILAAAGVSDFSFEYVKPSGSKFYTRPTSGTHYVIEQKGQRLEVTRVEPTLQSRMIELHKGHGPTAFKTFQKAFALGMVFIILSGLWLGLSSARLRRNTLLAAGSGLAVFVALLVL